MSTESRVRDVPRPAGARELVLFPIAPDVRTGFVQQRKCVSDECDTERGHERMEDRVKAQAKM